MKTFSAPFTAFAAIVCGCALSACTDNQVPPAPVAPAASASVATVQTAGMDSSGTLVKGVYTWGPEVETLSPCNTDKTYWLDGNEALLAPLQEIATKKADAANEAYQPVYLEARVTDAGRASDGFAVDYDGVMQLEDVLASSPDVPSDCTLLSAPEPSAPQQGPLAVPASATHRS